MLHAPGVAFAITSLSVTAVAQFAPGDIVVTNFSPPGAFAIPAAGGVPIPINSTVALVGPSGVEATSLGEVVIADFNANQLLLVQPSGSASIVAGALGGPLRVVEDHNGDFLVSALSVGLVRVTRQGFVTTVVPNGGPIGRVFGVAVDGNGDYIVADDNRDSLHRVTPQGTVTTLHAGPPFRLPQGVAILANGNYAVFDGLTDSVFLVDRATNAISTFVSNAALGGNPCGITASFDGGLLVSQSSSTLNQVVAIDPTGAVTPLASGAPFTNLEDVTRVRHLTGPVQLSTGPGSSFTLDLHVPTDGLQFYVTALAGSLYPGFTPFVGDPRGFSLVADSFFANTVGVNVAPVLVNWAGILDPQGRSTPSINMSGLPVGALSGLTFFVQSATLPLGSGASVINYSNVHVVAF